MPASPREIRQVIVIGAGVGGLTAAAALAQAGLPVTVLEAHIYPGGCAGTFHHQGYRFDAGATLAAGFYPGGPMDQVAQAAGIPTWEAHNEEVAMLVHLPSDLGSQPVPLHGGEQRWALRRAAFSSQAENFWQWQERTAEALWDLTLRLPAWPPQSLSDLSALAGVGWSWLTRRSVNPCKLPALGRDAFRTVAAHLPKNDDRLRLFVDAQLLISAQATSSRVNALYGASALDIARRGVVHLAGGTGAVAQTLVQAVRRQGGHVLYRQAVVRIDRTRDNQWVVETQRKERFAADLLIANLTPVDLRRLLQSGQSGRLPRALHRAGRVPADGWGAFTVYAGVDTDVFPHATVLHQQVVQKLPLGEGNSVFISISPEWDAQRAPRGQRAVTLSTHTHPGPWWRLFEDNRPAYEHARHTYAQRLLDAAELAFPGLRQATRLVLPGTPVTFQRFTRRSQGWVGGFPQTNLLRTWGPRLEPRLWLVGDSIFPGQSIAAVSLGGLRVAAAILQEHCDIPLYQPVNTGLLSSEEVL